MKLRRPKRRIADKVVKPEYRKRYEEHCQRRGEKALYNNHELFVGVVRLKP